MYLLQNNKIIHVKTQEDGGVITAIKTAEQKKEEVKTYSQRTIDAIVKDKIYQLKYVEDTGKGEYCFRVIQSEYNDDSSLNNGYGVYRTKAEAIMKMLDNNYIVYIDGKEFNV